MTQLSAPWNGIVTGDAANAPYDCEEWAAIWRDLVRASKADSGPLLGSGTSPDPGLTVSATSPLSQSVNVSAGSALVHGTWYNNSATVNLVVGANASGMTRIDTVVLRKNPTTQQVRLAVLPGTPAVTPVPPVLTQTAGLWEIPLADITCANGYVNVVTTMIRPRRHWANLADGVYLHDIVNNSGGTLETGDVVIWDTGADNAVTTLAVVNNAIGKLAGIWVGRTPAGGYGRVLVKGIGLVKVGGLSNRNSLLGPTNTTTLAQPIDAYPYSVFLSQRFAIGVALETAAANTLCRTYVDITAQRQNALSIGSAFLAGATNSGAYANVDAADSVSIITHTGRVKVTAMFTARFAVNTGIGLWTIYSDSLAANAGDLAELEILDVNDLLSIFPVHITAIFTGLDITLNQTFHLQHKATVGAGGQLVTDLPMNIYAEEL